MSCNGSLVSSAGGIHTADELDAGCAGRCRGGCRWVNLSGEGVDDTLGDWAPASSTDGNRACQLLLRSDLWTALATTPCSVTTHASSRKGCR
jgi:hypothetical protein